MLIVKRAEALQTVTGTVFNFSDVFVNSLAEWQAQLLASGLILDMSSVIADIELPPGVEIATPEPLPWAAGPGDGLLRPEIPTPAMLVPDPRGQFVHPQVIPGPASTGVSITSDDRGYPVLVPSGFSLSAMSTPAKIGLAAVAILALRQFSKRR